MAALHQRRQRGRLALFFIGLFVSGCLVYSQQSQAGFQTAPTNAKRSGAAFPVRRNLQFAGPWRQQFELKRGETFELSVSLPTPSALPTHGRIGVTWKLVQEKSDTPAAAAPNVTNPRAADAFGIYTKPTADWQKTLHALDPDVYLVYRAPVAGTYALELAPVTDAPTVFEGARWRETGIAPQAVSFPRQTPWPAGQAVPLNLTINPLNLSNSAPTGQFIEQEPNDTPEQAQPISFATAADADGVQIARISGGADDIEYFDNGKVGQSGDDWFKLVYQGTEPRLLTASLTIPDHTLAAQLRFYATSEPNAATADAGLPRQLLPLAEYTEGRNENERVHQQNEGHRAAISRVLKPGGVYFLRAEANAPGYEIELRLLKPAPYSDVRLAVRQAMYDHIGQVDAWLTNRPRGASVERRIRDSGNLMGTHCMSCHTQSGVWGPVVPMQNGYKLENKQNYRHLLNTMYESLRPTNYLKDAANNTSLAPLDIGDGPAGTRVTGHAVTSAELVVKPRKLHSMQALRAANHVLQTADPSGINAAGPGSNVGQSVVYNYSGEILRRAWDRTAHPRYLAALEEKAEKMLAVQPRYSDDMAHRIEFFKRFFPQDYLAQSQKAQATQKTLPPEPPAPPEVEQKPDPKTGKMPDPPPARFPDYKLLSAEKATQLWQRIQEQLPKDEARLRAIQNPDGSWGFDPGKTSDGGKTWKTDGQFDPAPTALALIALQAMGKDKTDPAVERGVQALLRTQNPYGRWNKAALTGFVTTAYTMHALARLYPQTPAKVSRADFTPHANESLAAAVARVRALSHTDDPAFIDLMIQATAHGSPWVRAWGAQALGGVHDERSVAPLLKALNDSTKLVRDSAAWALKQTLLDDHGFDAVLTAYDKGDDLTRESLMKALSLRADSVMPQTSVKQQRLAQLLGKAFNEDAHPGVRAWASKAAWQWWVWNPPTRLELQAAWTQKLIAPEANALVENCFRYQSHALFIANGHKANGSEEHQYKELAALFKTLEGKLADAALAAPDKDRLARRLVSIAATFYSTSGGDGGPGQMGYITEGSSDLMGKAALHLWTCIDAGKQANVLAEMQLLLEGSAGVGLQELQDKIIDYSTHGPESLRTLAAAAVSDPSAVTLPATQEKVEPLVDQIFRGAMDYDRRQSLAAPVLRLFSRAHWNVPKTVEQQELLYSLLIPKHKKEPSAAEVAAMLQAAADAVKPMGLMDADWYFADRMGAMLASNTDLHTEVLLRQLPAAYKNPLTAHFWLPSVAWVTEFGDGVPEIDASKATAATKPEIAAARARAIELYLQMLQPGTPDLSRGIAMRLANLTAVRNDPTVQQAFRKFLEKERNGAIQNALRTGDAQAWLNDLRAAVKAEPLAAAYKDAQGEPRLTEAFIANFRYFNDHVAPELARPQRMDEMSCIKCHGVKGRVPSMELEAQDGNGYWTLSKQLKNYLILQHRVDLSDIEASKLLRKPLNVQTGKEDGHQGGRRYLPAERGYQIIRRWVLDQPRVQQAAQTQSTGR